MPHIDDAREIYSKGSGTVAIGLLFTVVYFFINVAFVVFSVLAVISYSGDIKMQQTLLSDVANGENSSLVNGVYEVDDIYYLSYDKLDTDVQKYFDEDETSLVHSEKDDTGEQFLLKVLTDSNIANCPYNLYSVKTMVFAVIAGIMLLYLVVRAVKQIISLF